MSIKINYPKDEDIYEVDEYFNKNMKQIEDELNARTVDSEIDEQSEKPVQNKAIYKALAEKANAEHSHSMDDVEGLDSVLEDKAEAEHSHSIDDVEELGNALKGKAEAKHSHSTDDINGLSAALEGKADKSQLPIIPIYYGNSGQLESNICTVDIKGIDGKSPLINNGDNPPNGLYYIQFRDFDEEGLSGKVLKLIIQSGGNSSNTIPCSHLNGEEFCFELNFKPHDMLGFIYTGGESFVSLIPTNSLVLG